jgi:magnesium transporter
MHISALVVEKDRTLREVSSEDALNLHRSQEAVVWIHLFSENPEEMRELLADEFKFHRVAIEDAISKDERPELKEFSDHIFLVAPAMVGYDGEEEIYDEVGFFVTGNTIVSITHVKVGCIFDLRMRWSARQNVAYPEVGYLLFSLLDAILDSYFPVLDAIEDRVDEISDEIYEGKTDRMRELLKIKRRMLQIRRRLGPFRDVMNSLLRREMDFVTPPMAPYFHDLFDNTLRLTELVDTNREALTGLLDIHLSTVSNNLNQVMKKMTVISTVLMSCALVAGIYGMNFKTMPELDWKFGYPFSIALMGISGGLIVWAFKRFDWL